MQRKLFLLALYKGGLVVSKTALRKYGAALPHTNQPNVDFPSYQALQKVIGEAERGRKILDANEIIPCTVSINSDPYRVPYEY